MKDTNFDFRSLSSAEYERYRAATVEIEARETFALVEKLYDECEGIVSEATDLPQWVLVNIVRPEVHNWLIDITCLRKRGPICCKSGYGLVFDTIERLNKHIMHTE